MSRIEVPGREDIVGIRAENAGPFTLTGTNSWLVGRWLVDPGPALESHVEALASELERRGGADGIALTHDHPDHAAALSAMRMRFPGVPVAAVRGEVQIRLGEGSECGPL